MTAMILNCMRERQCHAVLFRLRVTSYMYGGNLNDVELCEGACIYNKDCVCYAVLLDLELLCIIILFLLSLSTRAHATKYNIVLPGMQSISFRFDKDLYYLLKFVVHVL